MKQEKDTMENLRSYYMGFYNEGYRAIFRSKKEQQMHEDRLLEHWDLVRFCQGHDCNRETLEAMIDIDKQFDSMPELKLSELPEIYRNTWLNRNAAKLRNPLGGGKKLYTDDVFKAKMFGLYKEFYETEKATDVLRIKYKE